MTTSWIFAAGSLALLRVRHFLGVIDPTVHAYITAGVAPRSLSSNEMTKSADELDCSPVLPSRIGHLVLNTDHRRAHVRGQPESALVRRVQINVYWSRSLRFWEEVSR